MTAEQLVIHRDTEKQESCARQIKENEDLQRSAQFVKAHDLQSRLRSQERDAQSEKLMSQAETELKSLETTLPPGLGIMFNAFKGY